MANHALRQWGHVTPMVRAVILDMLGADETYATISKKTRVSTTTIAKIAKASNLEPTTAKVSAGQRHRILLERQAAEQVPPPAIVLTGDADVDRYREERAARAADRLRRPELLDAKLAFERHFDEQRNNGKGGRPKGSRAPRVIVDGQAVARPEATLRQRILYAIDMSDLMAAGFRYTDMER